jgi:hypothetical protein
MRNSVTALLSSLLFVSTAINSVPAQESPVAARLELEPAVAKSTPNGPAFRLHLAIRNVGGRDLEVGKDFSRISNAPAYIQLGLRHENGAQIPATEMTSDPPPRPDWYYWTRIAPGNSYGTEIELDKRTYPDLYKTGRYTAVVWYTQRKCIVPSIDMSLPPLFITPEMHLKSNTITLVTDHGE